MGGGRKGDMYLFHCNIKNPFSRIVKLRGLFVVFGIICLDIEGFRELLGQRGKR